MSEFIELRGGKVYHTIAAIWPMPFSTTGRRAGYTDCGRDFDTLFESDQIVTESKRRECISCYNARQVIVEKVDD